MWRGVLVAMAVAALAGGGAGLSRAAPPGSRAPERTAVPPVALSDRSARALGVRPGDPVDLAPTAAGPWRRFRVARVYQPAVYPSEVSRRRVDVRLHLPDLQAIDGGRDEADSIVLRVRPPARAGAVAAQLNALPFGFRAYTSRDLARRSSSTFEVIARFHRAISVVTILASGVFLLTIMTLRGEEMRRQVGMLRLAGISRRSVAGALLLIAAGVALAGSLLGVGLGYLLSVTINLYYRRLFDTTLVFSRITPPLLGGAVGLSAALGIAAGAVTAWRLLRRRPLEQVGR